MNSREIVQRTVEYSGPERVAGSMPPPYWHDLHSASYRLQGYAPQWRDVGGGRQEYVDEWGNTWARVDDYSKGEVTRGAIEDVDDVFTAPLPDLGNPANYQWPREAFADPENDRFRIGSLPGFPFNVARKMRRLDQFFIDLMLERDKTCVLLKRIEDLLADAIVQYAEVGADAVMFPEDWGTQKGLMIHPDTWREVFKPGFERLCGVAHEHGIKVFMHSCGKTTAIIPDLIEAGIDLLQFDQPQLHGLDNLARFHGAITFWCPVDIQTTLQTQDAALIESDAKEMIEKLGGPDGGFIAGYYGGNEAIGLDPRWQDIACQAFARYGDYRDQTGTPSFAEKTKEIEEPNVQENVILVDQNDQPVGMMEKIEAHRKGVLHRAFSVFVFTAQDELLIQRRAETKYHCGGLWANTCDGHPRPGETTEEAAHRRLGEEMGFDCELEEAFHFIYRAELNSGLVEHEYDYTLIGRFDGEPAPDPGEASDWKWISLEALEEDVRENPGHYTPWFKIAKDEVTSYVRSQRAPVGSQ